MNKIEIKKELDMDLSALYQYLKEISDGDEEVKNFNWKKLGDRR